MILLRLRMRLRVIYELCNSAHWTIFTERYHFYHQNALHEKAGREGKNSRKTKQASENETEGEDSAEVFMHGNRDSASWYAYTCRYEYFNLHGRTGKIRGQRTIIPRKRQQKAFISNSFRIDNAIL